MINVGVHVSIAGKFYKSVERAAGLGCTTMQVFLRNPRQWRKGRLSDKDIRLFRKKIQESGINPVAVHMSYVSNLASSKLKFYRITIREFIIDLVEADKLGVNYLVTHMGSFKGGTQSLGLLRVANALNKIFEKAGDCQTRVLLENTAGSGKWLGSDFSHFRFIFERVKKAQNLGICLDTAHAWAAGYKINCLSGLKKMLSDIDKEAGIDKLKLIHLNDTEVELGSRIDRHLGIGEGKIGRKGFKLILNHPYLKKLPLILETPKSSDEDDISNLKIVRNLASSPG